MTKIDGIATPEDPKANFPKIFQSLGRFAGLLKIYGVFGNAVQIRQEVIGMTKMVKTIRQRGSPRWWERR